MFIYVAGSSKDGPCKIGVAADPKNRLRGLQTARADKLVLHHVEPVVANAKAVERASRRALIDRRTGGGREWFDITAEQARTAVVSAAASANVLIDDKACLQELTDRAVFAWLEEMGKREEARALREANGKDVDGCDDEEEEPVGTASILQLVAATMPPPRTKRLTFNDYLLTTGTGIWVRWAFEQLGRRMPSGRALKPYLDVASEMEDRWSKMRHKGVWLYDPAELWIQWSLVRELSYGEARELAQIWNKFVPLWLEVDRDGPQWPKHGVDDHVDDVHLLALAGDEDHGDRIRVLFLHPDFRAVLVPQRPVDLAYGPPPRRYPELQPLGDVRVSGFVTPNFGMDLWTKPLRPLLGEAAKRRDDALERFLGNRDKRYPAPRPYDGIPNGACVWACLPTVFDDGLY